MEENSLCATNNDNNNIQEANKNSIANFFDGQTIFITGVTGFLGQVILQRILQTTPRVKRVYVLVRAKNGHSPNDRIKKLMSKNLFDSLDDETKEKVFPAVGVLSDKNFGFSSDFYQQLLDEVNIVYHVAATIKFNTFIGSAIKINLIATQIVVQFTKKLRNLKSFIYVSTAFCNSVYINQGIKEKVYESEADPYEMIKLVESNPNYESELPQTGTQELRDILKSHPNTYTFTKQLAENLIKKELANYPVGIIRPSVVYGTYKAPIEGWVGTANSGHIGFVAGFSKGLFRTMCGDPKMIMDIIPVDYVAHGTIVLSWYVATHPIQEVEVIHCTSGDINPLTFGQYCDILNTVAKKHPNDFIICQPKVKVRNGLRYEIFIYLFHFIPALMFWVPEHFLAFKKPPRKTIDYVRIFNNGIKAFDYFTNKNFHYNMTNAIRILDCLNAEDALEYNYNVKYCDWKHYMEVQIKGIRYYFYKESKETTAWHRIMYNMYGIVQFLWYVVAFFIINIILSYMIDSTISAAITLCFLLFIKWV